MSHMTRWKRLDESAVPTREGRKGRCLTMAEISLGMVHGGSDVMWELTKFMYALSSTLNQPIERVFLSDTNTLSFGARRRPGHHIDLVVRFSFEVSGRVSGLHGLHGLHCIWGSGDGQDFGGGLLSVIEDK